jgi:hypothetical protein
MIGRSAVPGWILVRGRITKRNREVEKICSPGRCSLTAYYLLYKELKNFDDANN